MITTTIRLLCIGGLAAASTSALAQESLLDIYQRAVQNDPLIREAEAIYLAALETRPQALSSLLPALRLSASTSSSDSENPFPATNFTTGEPSDIVVSSETERDSSGWSVNLTQTVFDWSRLVTLKQADKQVARAETDYELARQALLVRVADAYFNVLAAEDTLASEVAAREAIGRQLEQAERRFEVGLIAITDVQEAQAGFDQAIAAEIAAQRALATSQELLREIIGAYISELASPTEDLPLVAPQPASADQWVDAALQQNLALISSRLAADIAQDDITIQRASRLPTLSFSSNLGDSESDTLRTNSFADGSLGRTSSISGDEGYNWSLNFSIPLYSGGFNASRIQQSVYQHRAALETLERIARQTERQARDAYLGVISEISRVRALRQAVESSRTALRATEAGFEVGTRTTVDVLASQNNLRRAETNYSRSRYDYLLNVLRLKEAAGSLSVEDLEEIDGWLE